MPARGKQMPFDASRLLDSSWLFGGGIGVVILLVMVFAGLASAVYTVAPEGRAVVKRFGRVVAIKDPGLHFKLPFGIDREIFVPTAMVLKEEFGFRTLTSGQRSQYRKTDRERNESLMLTGDLNVIDVEWVVQYRINDPDRYLHRVRNPTEAIRDISEAVMRQIVGNRLGSEVLTVGRVEIASKAREEIQRLLDSYDLGVQVATIELQDVTPPEPVKPAFNEVNEARQERERLINEAEKRRNQVIPKARGEAAQRIAEAEGYRARRVNRATGEASRFEAILTEYEAAPAITRQRLYLETLEAVLGNVERVYVMEAGTHAPLPLLDLGRPSAARAGREGGVR